MIAAIVDRLIYGSETGFDPEDARVLLDALPHRKTPRFEIGVIGRIKGGTSQGYAAGVGSVKVDDKNNRDFAFSTSKDATTRAGQWKLLWSGSRRGQMVEIEQVMSDVIEDGRGARVLYDLMGEPMAMDIRVTRAFKFFAIVLMFPAWKPWKMPRPVPDQP